MVKKLFFILQAQILLLTEALGFHQFFLYFKIMKILVGFIIDTHLSYTLIIEVEGFPRVILKFSDIQNINIFKKNILEIDFESSPNYLDQFEFTKKNLIINNPNLNDNLLIFSFFKNIKIESQINEALLKLLLLTEVKDQLQKIENNGNTIKSVSYEIQVINPTNSYVICTLEIIFNFESTVISNGKRIKINEYSIQTDGTILLTNSTLDLELAIELIIKNIQEAFDETVDCYQLLIEDQIMYDAYFKINKTFATLYGFVDDENINPLEPYSISKINTEDLLIIFKNYKIITKISKELRPRLL